GQSAGGPRGGPACRASLRRHVRDRRRQRRRGRVRDRVAHRRHPDPRSVLHAARVRDRDRGWAGFDGRRAAGRSAHRRAARQTPRSDGRRAKMMRDRRRAMVIGVTAVVLLALPFIASNYVLSVATLVLYMAYVGQAWNVMMGFAGQLSLGHSLYVGLGAYAAAGLFAHYGVGPWAGVWLAIAVCAAAAAIIGFLAFRLRVSGVHLSLLTVAFAELVRIAFDHIDALGGPGGLFLRVAARDRVDLRAFRGPPAMYYYAILALASGALALCAWLLRRRA